jgi:hypothetical protein
MCSVRREVENGATKLAATEAMLLGFVRAPPATKSRSDPVFSSNRALETYSTAERRRRLAVIDHNIWRLAEATR